MQQIFNPKPVDATEIGTRLDKWLAVRLPDLSRTRVKALIEGGMVSSEGATITDPSHRVKSGQAFMVGVPPDAPAEPQPQAIALTVVYEDDDLIVIDKPAGMVVHPAPGNPDETLVNALLAHCGDSLAGIGGVKRPGIVHRLDKDTSGLMVAAKTDIAHRSLSAQFAAHTLERAYRALVWGLPSPRKGEIEGNIGRNPRDRKKMAVVKGGGKPALTRYEVLQSLAGGAVSLDDDPHCPNSLIRNRIAPHSGQRSTSSSGAAAMRESSPLSISIRQAPHRRPCNTPAPTPPVARTRS